MFLARFHTLLRAHRCCLSVSSWDQSVLKFHSVGTSLMKIFDLYFSKRWSFLFPGTCLTYRRLSESVPRLFASGFPRLVCLFENPTTPSLARHNPSERHFSQQPLRSCRRFLFFLVNGRSFPAFRSVVRQPCDAGTNTYLLLYIPIRFSNTFQIVSTPLSKNDTSITFALDTSFPRHTSTSCH